MNERVVPLSEIKALPIPRALTGFDELDFIYGFSRFPEKVAWGIPQSKISLWSGTSGIGKSRLAIEVAKKISCPNFKILYFQTEAELSDFAGWTKDSSQYANIFCSGENRIKEMIEIIYEIKPQLIFIDSVNEIEEFGNGNKRETRLLMNGEDNSGGGLRKACQDLRTHIILLGQLNQDKTIKGGTSLPHLVDIALNLVPCDPGDKTTFGVFIGIKHRCGRREEHIKGYWKHNENGVNSISDHRLGDKIWCNSHNIQIDSFSERENLTLHEVLFRQRVDKLMNKDDFFTKIGKFILGK
jgi:predicted ATP-dependent serine protease